MMSLILAVFVIFIAHIVRVLRWQQLIMTYESPETGRLMRALSLGYFINFFIPFKLGELARALYAGRKMKNGRGFAFATVIIERCLDVLSVGIIFIIVWALDYFGIYKTASHALQTTDNNESVKSRLLSIIGINSEAGYYILLAASLFVVITLVYITRDIWKKYLFKFASMFNEVVEEKLLRFFWALIWGFKDILYKLPKLKLIFYTVFMWMLYLISYSLFAVFLTGNGNDKGIIDVFYSLFAQSSLFASGFAISTQTLMYAAFLLIPVLVLYLFSALVPKRIGEAPETINLLPHINSDERRTFLELYFSGENKSYIANYLKINRNILVLRDYSAGSNATTILCTDGAKSFYRKYAFAQAGQKLKEQIEWIESNAGRFPLTDIINKDVNDDACFYDMPYIKDAVTMFEYIHAASKEQAWDIIECVIDSLEKGLYTQGSMPDNEVADYIDSKILKNIEIIKSSKELKDILKYNILVINGTEYKNLFEFADYFSKENLNNVFRDDKVTEIHGDLTIENIICENDGFYLIDPNTGNILNSKYIDYAKMLQSLHGKYEYLQSVKGINVNDNNITFSLLKSDTYDFLYSRYVEYLKARFSDSELRSIFYHEVCNFLRLMPYKLKKGTGTVFYCGLVMILNDMERQNFL